MSRLSKIRRAAAALPLLVAAALWLGAPSAPLAQEAPCGTYSGAVCWKNESCVNIIFYKQCTTKYKYYFDSKKDLSPM